MLQVHQMAEYYHISDSDEPYLWAVAEMALCAPLPPGWEEETQLEEEGEAVMFRWGRLTGGTSCIYVTSEACQDIFFFSHPLMVRHMRVLFT